MKKQNLKSFQNIEKREKSPSFGFRVSFIINHPFLMVLCLVALLGCDRDKVLDIKPTGEIIPETVDDFRPLLDGLFSIESNGNYAIDLFMADELKILDGTLNDYLVRRNNSKILINALTWEKDFTDSQSTETDPNWINLYKGIYICNTLLKAMGDSKITGDPKLRAKLMAEAKVHRAFYHFSLVNLYAKQYDPASAANSLGIPVRTSPQRSPLNRWSLQDTYDFILKDLTEAINSHALVDKPDSKINRNRPSIAAAYGVLARVYLQMGKYQEALQAANHSLKLYATLADYNILRDYLRVLENPELLWYKFPYIFSSKRESVYVNDELLNLYTKEDARRNTMYRITTTMKGSKQVAFTEFAGTNNRVRYTGVSTGEMYLIRAECNARLGKLSLVANDLNTLRAKRIHNYSPMPAFTDKEKALSFVKQERRRELAGRGRRLFDLKRYNALDHAQISITHKIDGVDYLLPYNSNRWICPIPRGIIAMNPEIEQSPR